MITIDHYFGLHTAEDPRHIENARALLILVNDLIDAAPLTVPVNPVTKTQVSGTTLGGYRPQSCKIGAPQSAHKTGEAVDVYDPKGALDSWLTDATLEQFGLYREDLVYTPGWCHLTTRAPKSGKRTFRP